MNDTKKPRVILNIETSRESGRVFLEGIIAYTRLHGSWAIRNEPKGLADISPRTLAGEVDGMITRIYDKKLAERVVSSCIPVVFLVVNTPVPGSVTFIVDDKKVGLMAAQHLMDKGVVRFGFCGFSHIAWSEERYTSYRNHLEKAGFKVKRFSVPWNLNRPGYISTTQFQRMKCWLEGLPKPAGVFACNDDLGTQVTEACKENGLLVPEQIAVLGVDNDKLLCELSDPPLSSIALDFQTAGYKAAQELDALMKKPVFHTKQMHIEPLYIDIRRSSSFAHVTDTIVSMSVKYIADNAHLPLQVDDVAHAVGVSRRTLHSRFKEALGVTVAHEIRAHRLTQITKALLDTNASLTEISDAFDFPGVEKLSRFFKKNRGINPSVYRRMYKR